MYLRQDNRYSDRGNIQKTFGVNVKIAEVTSGGRTVKTIVPVSAADGFEKSEINANSIFNIIKKEVM